MLAYLFPNYYFLYGLFKSTLISQAYTEFFFLLFLARPLYFSLRNCLTGSLKLYVFNIKQAIFSFTSASLYNFPSLEWWYQLLIQPETLESFMTSYSCFQHSRICHQVLLSLYFFGFVLLFLFVKNFTKA